MISVSYITDTSLIDEMCEIEQASFPTPWSREDIVTDITEHDFSRYLGIFEDGTLIGWGCVWLRPAERVEVLLATVSIRPDKRGMGHGRALMNALIQASADGGGEYIELQCRTRNTVAQKLYESLGFLRVGKRKGYYTDTGDDAYIYVKINLPEGHPENDPKLRS